MSSASNSSEVHQNGDRKRRKMSKVSRHRRRSSQQKNHPIKNPFADLLEDIKEDVVSTRELQKDEVKLSPIRSIQSDIDYECKQYVQTIHGFKSVHVEEKALCTTATASHTIQRMWTTVSTICHGFLGGVSLTHLILIYAINPEEWPLHVLKRYAVKIAEAFGNLFYFLVTLCMVSVIDRMNTVDFQRNRYRSLLWIFLLAIYSVTILLSLTCESIDKRLYFGSGFNITINEDEMRLQKLLGIWNYLSVGRSAGAILGWICVAVMNNL